MFNAAGGSYRGSSQQPDALSTKMSEIEERVEVVYRNIKVRMSQLSSCQAPLLCALRFPR